MSESAPLPPSLEELHAALLTAKAFFAKDGSPSALRQIEDVLERYDAARAAGRLPRVSYGVQFLRKDGSDADRREHFLKRESAEKFHAGSARNGANVELLMLVEAPASTVTTAVALEDVRRIAATLGERAMRSDSAGVFHLMLVASNELRRIARGLEGTGEWESQGACTACGFITAGNRVCGNCGTPVDIADRMSAAAEAGDAPVVSPTTLERLRDLSARASSDWAAGRFATLHGGPVQHFERGSAQTQIATFTAPRRDLDDARDTADEQQANAEFALEAVTFVRALLGAPAQA